MLYLRATESLEVADGRKRLRIKSSFLYVGTSQIEFSAFSTLLHPQKMSLVRRVLHKTRAIRDEGGPLDKFSIGRFWGYLMENTILRIMALAKFSRKVENSRYRACNVLKLEILIWSYITMGVCCVGDWKSKM
jgi:hypothetical protein